MAFLEIISVLGRATSLSQKYAYQNKRKKMSCCSDWWFSSVLERKIKIHAWYIYTVLKVAEIVCQRNILRTTAPNQCACMYALHFKLFQANSFL